MAELGSDAPPHWWEKDIVPGMLLGAVTLISFALQNTGARGAFDAFLRHPIGSALSAFSGYLPLSRVRQG